MLVSRHRIILVWVEHLTVPWKLNTFLTLVLGGVEWLVGHWPCYPRYLLDKKLSRPQNWSGYGIGGIDSCLCLKSDAIHRAHSLVTLQMELSHLDEADGQMKFSSFIYIYIYCTMLGSLGHFWSPIVPRYALRTPLRLVIGFIYNLTHKTTITHNYFLRCVTFTQLTNTTGAMWRHHGMLRRNRIPILLCDVIASARKSCLPAGA
jgi:hypothetical protein